jgi:hypothetical protein
MSTVATPWALVLAVAGVASATLPTSRRLLLLKSVELFRSAFQLEIFERDADGRRHPRRIGALALDAVKPVATAKQKVQLRSLMRRPEPSVVVRLRGERLLYDESLPRSAYFGMGFERLPALDAEHRVQ